MRVGQNPAKSIDQVAKPADITVAIVTYIPYLGGYYAESLEVLKACLESLWQHTDLPYDLLVFDNASCPEVRAFLADAQQRGKIQFLLSSDRNIGKGGAWNLIFGGAPGRIIAYADSDIYFYPGWLSAQVQVLESIPEAGMVTGMPLWSPLEFSTSTIQWAEIHPEALPGARQAPALGRLLAPPAQPGVRRGKLARLLRFARVYLPALPGAEILRRRRAFPVCSTPGSVARRFAHPFRAPYGTGACAGHCPGSERLSAPIHAAMVGAAPGEHSAGLRRKTWRTARGTKGSQPPYRKERLVEMETRPPPVDLGERQDFQDPIPELNRRTHAT